LNLIGVLGDLLDVLLRARLISFVEVVILSSQSIWRFETSSSSNLGGCKLKIMNPMPLMRLFFVP